MKEITRLNRYILSILSGFILFISFPYTGSLTFLSFFAWIPLLIVEQYITSKKYRSSKIYIHAFIAFFIYNLGSTWWIWNASEGGAIFAIFLNALIMAFVFYIYHIVKKTLAPSTGTYLLPIFWIAFEFIHYHWELSYPWLNLGNVFSILPETVQWYSITGVLGGTLWILITNILLFNFLYRTFITQHNWKKEVKFIVAGISSLIIPVIISLYIYSNYKEEKNPIEIVAIQPNVDPYNEKFYTDLHSQLDKLFDEADKKITKNTDFVLAPETAISSTFYEEETKQLPFYQYINERTINWGKTLLLTGASTARFFTYKNSHASLPVTGGPGFIEYYNSSLLINNFKQPVFIHKSKLVLGVEKIPFSRWIPWLEELSIKNGGTSGTLGIEKEPKNYSTKTCTFGPCICYESIYGEFIAKQCKKGNEALFIITNDGWWGDTPGYKQHASFARLRAIENRRSIARSANTGISCFINQRGDVSQATKWWVPTAINGVINKNRKTTFYTENGDLIGETLAIMSVLLLGFGLFKKTKKLIGK